MSSSLGSVCCILISPIKYQTGIGHPCFPRHNLGKKPGLVLIRQPFVNVRTCSGPAAMETRAWAEASVSGWSRKVPFTLRQGVFSGRCSRIQQLSSCASLPAGEGEGENPARAGPSAATPGTDGCGRGWRVPQAACVLPTCCILQWRRRNLERRAARELNRCVSYLCCAVLFVPSLMLLQCCHLFQHPAEQECKLEEAV